MFSNRLILHELFSFRALFVGLVSLGALSGVPMQAFANDGGISMGGSPRLLSGHPSVTMTSEVINIVVDKDERYKVDCQFVFTNEGPAFTVRMGFPDVGEGVGDPDEELDPKEVLNTPPHTTFTSFRSYVDGRRVATKLIRANEEGHYWHTKLVRFPAHSVRRIRDVYTQRLGGGIFTLDGGKNGYMKQVAYTLHTGSSWHGSIGRSEVNITFRSKAIPQPLQLIPLNTISKTYPNELRVNSISPNAVTWKGPCAPQIQGKTLHFVRTNWRPTAKDDLLLTYDYRVMQSQ